MASRDILQETDFQISSAIYAGQEDKIEKLLTRGCNVNRAIRQSGETPLITASHLGNNGVVRLLIRHGADVNLTVDGGPTPLVHACMNNNVTVVTTLLQSGANPNAGSDSSTLCSQGALYWAVNSQNPELVQSLIDYGAAVDTCYSRGNTILHVAAALENTDITRILLNSGANINATDHRGETPAAKALITNPSPLRSVECLLKSGADVNICSNNGSNFLHLTSVHSAGNIELAHLLLCFGCRINERNYHNDTPLYLSLLEIPHKKDMAIELSKYLIKHGAVVNDEAIYSAMQIKNPFGFVRDLHQDIFLLSIEAGLVVANIPWIHDYLSRNFSTSTNPVDLCSHISEDMEVRFEKHRKLQGYLRILLCDALPLKQICRIYIRKHLILISSGCSIYFKISKLSLPNTVVKTLRLDDVKF